MNDRRTLWLAIAIAALAALVFLPALGGPWISDDHVLIEGNAQVHTLSAAHTWLSNDFWYALGIPNRLHYWRPLITASYAVDWQLGGGHPQQFHITNTIAHAFVAVLVFLTLRRWTTSSWAAFAAAALWVVHPTKAENVAWISGRTDVLCMAFLLVAAAGMARRLRGARGSGLALEIAGTVGAYMCKEQAVVLPIFAAVEAWVAAGRPAIDRALVRPIVRAVIPQTLVTIGYVIVRAIWMPIATPQTLGLFDHVRVVLESYGRFIALTFAPHDLSLQHALVRWHDGSFVYSTPFEIFGAAALVATLAIAVASRRRFPAATAGISVFLFTIAPTLNIAQTNQQTLISERFLYVPTLGLALVLAAALGHIPASAVRRVQLLLAAIAVALGAQALSRTADFGDEDAFWNRELRLHPDSSAGLEYVMTNGVQKHVLARIADATDRDKDQAAFASDVLDIFASAVSDRDPTALRDLDAAAATVLAHRTAGTQLAALGVTVKIDMGPGFAAQLAPVASRIDAARAELAARFGDPAASRRAAAAEAEACGGCEHAHVTAALAEARGAALGPPADADAGFAHALAMLPAGHDDVAARINEARRAAVGAAQARGAAQLQARASELSALGLWGAAYKVLQPRFGEITMLSHASTAFAKLAFRAGDTADAADALASAMPAEQIRGTLEGWAREIGWLGPTSAGGPSSP